MWQQLSGDEAVHGQLPMGQQQLGSVAWRDTTVEDLVAIVQHLPHREPVVPAVMHGYSLSSAAPQAVLNTVYVTSVQTERLYACASCMSMQLLPSDGKTSVRSGIA